MPLILLEMTWNFLCIIVRPQWPEILVLIVGPQEKNYKIVISNFASNYLKIAIEIFNV